MRFVFNNKIIILFRLISGLIFLTSAVSKAIYTGSFVFLIEQYGFESISQAAPSIIITEAILGFGLLLNVYPKFMTFSSMLLTGFFTIAYVYAYWFNGITDCGCFGTIPLNLSPTFTIIRNIILLFMLYLVYRKSSSNSSIAYWKLLVGAILIPAISFVSGFTYFDQMPNKKKHTNTFLHKPLNETPLKQFVHPPQEKSLVFCFSYKCHYCLNSFGNLLFYRSYVDTIITLALEDPLNKQEFLQYVKPNIEISDISSEQMNNITNQFPTTFFIKNDTIVYQHTGFLPSPVILKDVIKNFH